MLYIIHFLPPLCSRHRPAPNTQMLPNGHILSGLISDGCYLRGPDSRVHSLRKQKGRKEGKGRRKMGEFFVDALKDGVKVRRDIQASLANSSFF